MDAARDIDALLKEAVDMGGSDLHLSVGAPPCVRIHGKMTKMNYSIINRENMDVLISGQLDAYARSMLNSSGQYDTAYTVRGVSRFRVNVFRQKGDLAAVFRTLPDKIPDFNKLRLPSGFFSLHARRRGLILVVGPTGSGKTTTLASFINIINRGTYKHIITLEDPIEYLHWHASSIINQRQIGADCDSFANGLRAALREDPDVILVGEMRDLETTEIAVTAAETGHLVCSTLHTLGAAETVNRILDMYPERQQNQVRSQLASILEAVLSQQLLPRADGKGYIVAYELMYKTRKVRDMIKNKQIDEISDYLMSDEAKAEGMSAMDDTIFNLLRRGLVTRDVALDYSFDRRVFQNRIVREGL